MSSTYLRIRQKLGAEMATRPGWEVHPEQDYHFRHPATDVHLMIYGSELAVTFGRGVGERYDKMVTASTKYLPGLAMTSVLEVADALVTARTLVVRPAEATRPEAG